MLVTHDQFHTLGFMMTCLPGNTLRVNTWTSDMVLLQNSDRQNKMQANETQEFRWVRKVKSHIL